MSSREWFQRLQYVCFWAVKWAWLYTLSIIFGFRVYYRGRIPRSGPLLVAANHQSFLDPFLCGVPMPRTMKFMARRSLFRNAIFGTALRLINVFPVTRAGRDVQALRTAIRELRAGRALLVFPEGTRSRGGEIGPFRAGMDVLARRSGATVLPMAVDGGWLALPRDSARLRPVPLMAAFGRPIRPEEVARMSRDELSRRVREEMTDMLRLLRERRDQASGGTADV